MRCQANFIPLGGSYMRTEQTQFALSCQQSLLKVLNFSFSVREETSFVFGIADIKFENVFIKNLYFFYDVIYYALDTLNTISFILIILLKTSY